MSKGSYTFLWYPPADEHLIDGARIYGPLFQSADTAASKATEDETEHDELLDAFVCKVQDGRVVEHWRVDMSGTIETAVEQLTHAVSINFDMRPIDLLNLVSVTHEALTEAERGGDEVCGVAREELENATAEAEPEELEVILRASLMCLQGATRQKNPAKSPKPAGKGSKPAASTEKPATKQFADLTDKVKKYGEKAMKGRPKGVTKEDTLAGVVAATKLTRAEARAIINKVTPPPPRKKLTEEEKKKREKKKVERELKRLEPYLKNMSPESAKYVREQVKKNATEGTPCIPGVGPEQLEDPWVMKAPRIVEIVERFEKKGKAPKARIKWTVKRRGEDKADPSITVRASNGIEAEIMLTLEFAEVTQIGADKKVAVPYLDLTPAKASTELAKVYRAMVRAAAKAEKTAKRAEEKKKKEEARRAEKAREKAEEKAEKPVKKPAGFAPMEIPRPDLTVTAKSGPKRSVQTWIESWYDQSKGSPGKELGPIPFRQLMANVGINDDTLHAMLDEPDMSEFRKWVDYSDAPRRSPKPKEEEVLKSGEKEAIITKEGPERYDVVYGFRDADGFNVYPGAPSKSYKTMTAAKKAARTWFRRVGAWPPEEKKPKKPELKPPKGGAFWGKRASDSTFVRTNKKTAEQVMQKPATDDPKQVGKWLAMYWIPPKYVKAGEAKWRLKGRYIKPIWSYEKGATGVELSFDGVVKGAEKLKAPAKKKPARAKKPKLKHPYAQRMMERYGLSAKEAEEAAEIYEEYQDDDIRRGGVATAQKRTDDWVKRNFDKEPEEAPAKPKPERKPNWVLNREVSSHTEQYGSRSDNIMAAYADTERKAQNAFKRALPDAGISFGKHSPWMLFEYEQAIRMRGGEDIPTTADGARQRLAEQKQWQEEMQVKRAEDIERREKEKVKPRKMEPTKPEIVQFPTQETDEQILERMMGKAQKMIDESVKKAIEEKD